jgi:spire-like protein
MKTVETSRTKITDNEITPAPRRRLIKADLTLRLSNSFDDEEDNDIFNANESQVFHKPEEEESLSLPTQPEKKSRRFSLRNCEKFLF